MNKNEKLINLSEDYYNKINRLMKINGEKRLTIKAIEEMSELQHELSRLLYDKESGNQVTNFAHIEEEIADTIVMLQQVMLINNINVDTIKNIIEYKIDRQCDRFSREDMNNKKGTERENED